MKYLKSLILCLAVLVLFSACTANKTDNSSQNKNTVLNEESFIKDLKTGLEARWALGSRADGLQGYKDSVSTEYKYLEPYENITFADSYYENIRKSYMEALIGQKEFVDGSTEESFMSTEEEMETWDDTTYARYKIIVELSEKSVLDVPSELVDSCKNYTAMYDYGYAKFYTDINENADVVEADKNSGETNDLIKVINPLPVDLYNATLYLSAYGAVGEGDDADYEYLGDVNVEKIELWKAGEEISFIIDSAKYEELTANYQDTTFYISFVG